MKENGQKKALLSALGVAILVVAVVGISFAAYQSSFNSTSANSVSTGTIMVSYTEPTNAINITDAMPLSDANGMSMTGAGKTFDFTVSTKVNNALTVPYTITLTKVNTSTLLDNQIKVYITKNGSQVVAPTLVDNLTDSAVRNGSKVLYSDSDVYTNNFTQITTNYVLRMWIDKDVSIDSQNSKTYIAKVNVDSAVTPIA